MIKLCILRATENIFVFCLDYFMLILPVNDAKE